MRLIRETEAEVLVRRQWKTGGVDVKWKLQADRIKMILIDRPNAL